MIPDAFPVPTPAGLGDELLPAGNGSITDRGDKTPGGRNTKECAGGFW